MLNNIEKDVYYNYFFIILINSITGGSLFFYFLATLKAKLNAEREMQLLKKIAAKDEEALEELYSLYSRILYSTILKIVKQVEDAEEILQNVFLIIWEKASSFNYDKGNVFTG